MKTFGSATLLFYIVYEDSMSIWFRVAMSISMFHNVNKNSMFRNVNNSWSLSLVMRSLSGIFQYPIELLKTEQTNRSKSLKIVHLYSNGNQHHIHSLVNPSSLNSSFTMATLLEEFEHNAAFPEPVTKKPQISVRQTVSGATQAAAVESVVDTKAEPEVTPATPKKKQEYVALKRTKVTSKSETFARYATGCATVFAAMYLGITKRHIIDNAAETGTFVEQLASVGLEVAGVSAIIVYIIEGKICEEQYLLISTSIDNFRFSKCNQKITNPGHRLLHLPSSLAR
jgi:hypothetical protein